MDHEDSVSSQGSLGGDWSISHSKREKSGTDAGIPFSLQADASSSPPTTKLSLHEEFRWLRIEYELPGNVIKEGKFFFLLTYKKLSGTSGNTTSVKIIEYIDGVGQTYVSIFRDLSLSEDFTSTSRPVTFFGPGVENARYRLCFEFKQPVDFWFGDVELVQVPSAKDASAGSEATSAYYPPYRTSQFQVSEKLCHLNDRMDVMMRKTPVKWTEEMLRVALRLEDYETATGLAKYLEHLYHKDGNSHSEAIGSLLQARIATGEFDQVFELLARFASASKSDSSVSIARRLRSDDKPLSDYRLPSGKGDVFNLSYDLRNPGEIPFETVLTHTPESSERSLLWANYFLHRSEEEYLRQINRYLEDMGSPYETELGGARNNILARIGFKPRKGLSLISSGPLVSVIIAAYNAADTIDYALGSILKQTYKDIEILVCDDGSDDETLDVLRQRLPDPRVRVFKSASNQGPYNIRNQMISEARGEVVTFHDADDLALPHRIATQLQLMMDSKSRVSLGMWLRIRENGHFVAFKEGSFLRQCLNSIMFFKTVFDDYGPYREAACAADSEFYESIRGLLEPEEISYATQPLVLGLWSPRSLTQSDGIKADEVGYRSAARRSYSSLASRQRILGREIVTDDTINNTLKDAGIYRRPQKTIEFKE